MSSRNLFLSFIFILIFASCSEQDTALPDAGVVGQFYESINVIINDPDSDEAYSAKENCIEVCQVSDWSMNFPNEFKWMGLIDREENDLSILSYITLLRKFAKKSDVHFHFSMVDTYLYLDERKDSAEMFRYYIMMKEYSMPDFKCSFIDTVLVSPDSLIVGIKNRAGGHAFTKYELTEPISDIMTK